MYHRNDDTNVQDIIMLYRHNNFVEKIIEEKKERRQERETPDKLHETINRIRQHKPIQCFQAADKRHNRIMENNCTPILPSNPFSSLNPDFIFVHSFNELCVLQHIIISFAMHVVLQNVADFLLFHKPMLPRAVVADY